MKVPEGILQRYHAACTEMLNMRGYVVMGSSLELKIGALWKGGRFRHDFVKDPFYVLSPTDLKDFRDQRRFLEKYGFQTDGDPPFPYFYRVSTD